MGVRIGFLLVGFAGFGAGFVASRWATEVPPTLACEELKKHDAKMESLIERLSMTAPVGACAVAVDKNILREEVRAALRQELPSASAPRVPSEPPREPEPALESAPSPENIAAADSGRNLLQKAIEVKRWDDTNASQLHQYMLAMTSAQRAELMREIAVAINRGDLTVVTEGPPF